MFAVLGFLLVIVWLGAFVTMKTASVGLHILLFFAVISFIAHFFSGASTNTTTVV